MPPPPPPPGPPPPPTFPQANTEKPSLSKTEQVGRNALLSDICKPKKLKKAVTNDRSAPIVSVPKGPGGGGGGVGGGPAGLGGLFAGGMPKLRSAGSRESSDSGGSRPPIMPPGGRSSGPRPFAPSNTPPKIPGSSGFPRNNNPELARNKLPQPKFSRPEISSKPDAVPPPLPNAPRPSASSMQNRGPPPALENRPPIRGPSLPNRNQGSSRPFSPAVPQNSANRSLLPPTPNRVVEDKPSPPMPPVPSTNRPPLPPTPVRMTDDRPLPPPMTNRPSLNRDGPPLPPPQHQKPPVPQTPRPTPSFQAPPPPPPNRPGPSSNHSSSATDVEIPKLPQRNLSLHSTPSTSPGPIRSGPLPPGERPPPPVRDPPSRSGPLPPPPPVGRNGSSQKAPPVPQPPSRMGSDTRSGFRPPLPPDRGSPVPPPTSLRNGFQESSQAMCEDEWEGRFSFHSTSDFPPPEPYVNFPKTYPSKQNKAENRDSGRRERGAPPLPPIPPIPR